MPLDSVYRMLGALESYPVMDTVTKEVVGINAPKIALTRSETERMDVAVSEIGNTLAFGVGGLAADQAFRKIFKQAQSTAATETQKHWAELGRSMGIYSLIFSVMWAMPFVRNYVTAKRTGRVRFTDVIEVNKHQESDKHQEHKSALQETLAYYRNRALGILGLGIGGAAASVGFARWAAAPGREIGKNFLKRLADGWVGQNLLLKGGEFSRFGGWPALLFWGVPAYGGWLHASRDPYERKEQLLKFGNFVACFFGPSIALKAYFSNELKKLNLPDLGRKAVTLSHESIEKAKPFLSELSAAEQPVVAEKLKQAEGLWMKQSGLGLLSSIVLLGAMPQLMNIHLTKRRMQRDLSVKQVAHRYGAYGQAGNKPPVARMAPNTASSGLAYAGSSVPAYGAQRDYPMAPQVMPVKPAMVQPSFANAAYLGNAAGNSFGNLYGRPMPASNGGAQFWRPAAF